MDTADFHRELERRLAILEDPGYADPAAVDVPKRDWAILLLGCLVLIVALLGWGYPW